MRCWRATGASRRCGRITICPITPPLSAEEAIERIHDGVKDAVERQMVADVPVGAFLSGGLDSSSVVAFAKEHAKGGDVPCFTISFARAGAKQEGIEDDLPYARRVARHLGVSLDEVSVGPDSLRMLPDMVYMMDE